NYTVKSGYRQALLQCDTTSNNQASSSHRPQTKVPGSEIFSASSPPMAELYAICGACLPAVTYGWQNAMVESGSKVVISLFYAQVDPPWSLSAIVVDIKVWASQSGISFS
nr:F-box domain, FBD domain, leucine-rich repeat domain, L domain-like protein [Tanacetum cinerariifolium]